MSQPNDIALILQQSHAQEWPFPKQFEALKKVGVTSYEVVPSTYDAVFYGDFGIWHNHQAPDDTGEVSVAAEFDQEAFLAVLDQRMKKNITYIGFLQGIALAGVDRYVVDMADRTVKYYGIDEEHLYVQNVPEIIIT
jgi:uncharacterized protein YbcV (DUF1398 family)